MCRHTNNSIGSKGDGPRDMQHVFIAGSAHTRAQVSTLPTEPAGRMLWLCNGSYRRSISLLMALFSGH
jgi:hypothetical protein